MTVSEQAEQAIRAYLGDWEGPQLYPTYREVARHLNQKGIFRVSGQPWNADAVIKLMERRHLSREELVVWHPSSVHVTGSLGADDPNDNQQERCYQRAWAGLQKGLEEWPKPEPPTVREALAFLDRMGGLSPRGKRWTESSLRYVLVKEGVTLASLTANSRGARYHPEAIQEAYDAEFEKRDRERIAALAPNVPQPPPDLFKGMGAGN